ncbi:MAG: sulfatase-like hydrolase/transferase [Gammaproteobacteria bacterium]|nr:sulfatase-like hydrolase/transferase [Gammaproteobacteria bacterium]
MNPLRSAVLSMLALLSCVHAAAAPQPNILLIYVDDLGYGDLASFGHPVLQTPTLDSLADSGLTFTNYYAPSALCSPSRAGLLTGRNPYRSGIKSWIPEDSGVYLRDEEITLAEVLKAAGYRTALMGKWHLNSDLGSKTEPQPEEQGFDSFYGHNAFQIPTNHNPTNIYRGNVALGMQEGYTADLYVDEAIRWLEQEDEDKPFFLYLSMAEPHTSIENPPEYNRMYADFTLGEAVGIPNGGKIPPKDQLIPRGPGEYYANITYMDAQLGRLLEWLEANGLHDDTVVVFTSDNGPVTDNWINWWEVNAYGSTGGFKGRKHFLYEGGIKVPAIIRYPGVTRPATVSDALVVGTDLFVTLAKIGGGQIPQDRPIDGIDITAALSGGELPARSLFWALDSVSEMEYAVRDGDWKLLLDHDRQPRELYNLDEDPLEFFNLLQQNSDEKEALYEFFKTTLLSIESDTLRP